VKKETTGRTGQPDHLCFGILCNPAGLQQWQADAVAELIAHGHRPVLLVHDGRSPQNEHSIFHRFRLTHLLFRILNRSFFQPPSKRHIPLPAVLESVDALTCQVIQTGKAEYFQEEEIAAIRNYSLDFILRFGFNIIKGDILEAARYGVWSFHHDDEMKYRGGPAGFWEIYHGEPVTGAILQRLTEKLDAGVILYKGYLKTMLHSYKGNLDQLLRISSTWPALVADELVRKPETCYPLSETKAPLYKLPGNLRMVIFLFRIFIHRIQFHYRDLLSAEVWNVGLIRKPIREVAFGEQPLRPLDITWLRRFANTKYLADPFGFFENHKLHILVEDYSYKKQQGSISEIIYDVRRDSFSVPIHLIEEEKHLSYPFLVEHEKMVYCVPESHRSKQVELYRRNYSEEAFVKDKVLIPNVDAIDPTLFLHEGKWWLFFTLRKYSTAQLFIYHSDDIHGPYVPHVRNPVKTDVRSSRPGGTPFVHEGVLYRPAQDCSLTYGGKVVVNRVVKLTTEEFEEIPVREITPVRNTPFSKGLHTLSQAGSFTLIDGKRYRINSVYFVHQLRAKLRKRSSGNV